MQTQTIQGGQSGPHLLITAGVHGDEFTPMAAVRRIAELITAADLTGTLTLVPVVNEAAWKRGRRVADDGLDLARTCPGQEDGSVTEQTAFAISQLIRSADYYIDLHTGSRAESILPLSGYTLHPQPEILKRQREMAMAFNLPIIWGTSPNLEGRTLSVARDAEIPAIYAEYLGSGVCDPNGVADYVSGCLNVMALLEMLDCESPKSQIKLIVEDPRDKSGHMQVHNPAPASGFFRPAVQLGDQVVEGQLLGTITNERGDEIHTIGADRTGLLLGLRTFPRTERGDMTGVILELDNVVFHEDSGQDKPGG